jgi:hypothetical protein
VQVARNLSKKQNAKHVIVLVSSCWLAAALARRLDDLAGWFGGMGTWVQVAGLRWMSWCAVLVGQTATVNCVPSTRGATATGGQAARLKKTRIFV